MADGGFVVCESDADLLNRSFSTRDPEILPDLFDTIEEPYSDWFIEFKYDVTPPKGTEKPYIYCAHCRKRTHWKGYVIGFGARGRATIGNCCGKEQFGLEFSSIEKKFNRLLDRKSKLQRLIELRPHFIALRSDFTEAINTGLFERVDEVRAEMRLNWRDILLPLVQALRNDDSLEAEYTVTDEKEYERRRQSVERYYSRQIKPRMPLAERKMLQNEQARELRNIEKPAVLMRRSFGNIAGATFLRNRNGVAEEAIKLEQQAKQILLLLNAKSDALSDKQINDAIQQELAFSTAVRDIAVLAAAMLDFFTKRNIERIADWASFSFPNRGVAANGNSLILRDKLKLHHGYDANAETAFQKLLSRLQ